MKLILKNYQSPGDILMLTGAVEQIKFQYPEYSISVNTSCPVIWKNNPHITNSDENFTEIECHYTPEESLNSRQHFNYSFINYLNKKLNLNLNYTKSSPKVYLDLHEQNIVHFKGLDLTKPYWIINAGGKYDFTVKWWPPEYYAEVINHFKNKITFAQVGEKGHWHIPQKNTFNLLGKTTLRDLMVLMYRAQGFISPVSFLNHLSAAVKPYRELNIRPGIVIAGGAEPVNWEYYNGTQYLHNVGCYDCNQNGGCWKSKVIPISGDEPKHTLCQYPTETSRGLMVSRCMNDIKPKDVIQAIEKYYEGGVLKYNG